VRVPTPFAPRTASAATGAVRTTATSRRKGTIRTPLTSIETRVVGWMKEM